MASDIFPANYSKGNISDIQKSSRSMSSSSGNCTPRNSTFQLTARGSLCLNERLGVLCRKIGLRLNWRSVRPAVARNFCILCLHSVPLTRDHWNAKFVSACISAYRDATKAAFKVPDCSERVLSILCTGGSRR